MNITALPIVITSADCVAVPSGKTCSKSMTLPAGAHYLGATLGEFSPAAFTTAANSTITAGFVLGALGSLFEPSPVVGPALPATSFGTWPAASNGVVPNMLLIEMTTVTLSVTTAGAAINLVQPGGSLTGTVYYAS